MLFRSQGLDATDLIERSPALAAAIDAIEDGTFSPDERDRFAPIAHSLRYLDYYLVSADFDDYYRTQRLIDAQWDEPNWTLMGVLNVARMGWFSADRAIREYAEDIWDTPVQPDLAS